MKMLNRLKSTAIILKKHKLKFAALLTVFSLISFALPLTVPFMIQAIMGKIESGMSVTPLMILSLIAATLCMLTLDYVINVYGNVMCANLIYRGSADLYKDLFGLPYGEREAKYNDKDLLQNMTAFTDSALSLWVMIIRLVISVIVIVGQCPFYSFIFYLGSYRYHSFCKQKDQRHIRRICLPASGL